MLNWLELRINVFGSEQKSLRAWQCSKTGVCECVRGEGSRRKREIRQREKLVEALTG